MSSSDPAAARSGLSLRARTTIAFLGTAAAVSAAAFLALHLLLRDATLRRIDRDVEFFVHERAAEYLTGRDYDGPRRAVPASRLPPDVLRAFRERHPDARPAVCFSDDGRRFWFCAAAPDGAAVVAECGPDPASLRTETFRPADRVATIAEAFSEPVPGEGYGYLFHLLLAPGGGEVLAQSRMPDDLLARMIATGREERDIRGLRHLRFDGALWAADTEPFFDGSVYVVFHRVDEAPARTILATAAATFALLLAAAFLVAWRLAGSIARGIERIERAARRARDGDYAARIGHRRGEGAEIDRLVDAVNEMLARTKSAIGDLRDLSDDMAHDLKTPLTRLLARAELAFLEKTPSLPAGEVAEECRSMLGLVNALLDLSRAVNGPRPAPDETADLADVVRRSASLFSALAEDRRVALRADVPGTPLSVRAPLVHVQRIAANLLDNALKFTPEGGRVEVSVRRCGRRGRLNVSDTGPGIPAADRPHVFKRFWRSDASRSVPGNGLGLALVKALAERCGGAVAVDEAPGGGASFAVELPLA